MSKVQALPVAASLKTFNLALPEFRQQYGVEEMWSYLLLMCSNDADMLIDIAALYTLIRNRTSSN